MALTKNQQTVQDIFGQNLGRQAATEGLDYWTKQLDEGKSVADLIRGIQSGSEYKARQDEISKFGETNDGSIPSEAYLDARISPGGGIFDLDTPGMAPEFAADNTWSNPLMTSGNNTWTDELSNIYQDLKIGGASETGSPHYNTTAAENTGNFNVGVTHDAAGNPITNTGTGDTGTGDTGVYNADGDTGTADTGTGDTGTGDTGTGTGNWYDGYASGEDWLKANPQDTGNQNSGGMDDFFKFMMFMNMMRPQGGGFGGSQYGYGGLNPGGVQSAYNPMENFSGMMDAFKSIGTNLTNTGTT